MSLSDRRWILGTLAACALAGCGFEPVYAPGGSGSALVGQIAFPDPQTPLEALIRTRLEERLGVSSNPTYRLDFVVNSSRESLGTTSDGRTTRFHLTGTARVSLVPVEAKDPVLTDTLTAFSAYSATGSTVATLAAERDARARLATLLADRIVDTLLLRGPGVTP